MTFLPLRPSIPVEVIYMKELRAGTVQVWIAPDESIMGTFSAEQVATQLKQATSAGKDTALWLMAAPSGFAFYKAFILSLIHI